MSKSSRTNRRVAALPVVAVVAVLAAGCGSSGSSDDAAGSPTDHSTMDMSTMSPAPSTTAPSSASTGAAESAVMLTIKDFKYSGADKVSPGATITVKNEDSVAHTVTADSAGGFDVVVAPGKSATFKAPTEPGDYAYHCTYHANMHGTLTVG